MKMYKFLSVYVALTVFHSTYGARELIVDGVRTLFAMEGEEITISCDIEQDMSYCRFEHPHNSQLSVVTRSSDNATCTYQLNVTESDEGDWTCRVGKTNFTSDRDSKSEELTETTRVRVTGALAAVQTNITVRPGDDVILGCITVPTEQPIKYCKMTPPQGRPAFIVKRLNRNRPSMKNYFSPAYKSLNLGDCAVTILNAKYEDSGDWQCAAWFEGYEHSDTITLTVQVDHTSMRRIIILTLGLIIVLAVSIFFIIYFKLKANLVHFDDRENREMAIIVAPRPEQIHDPQVAPPAPRFLTPPRQQLIRRASGRSTPARPTTPRASTPRPTTRRSPQASTSQGQTSPVDQSKSTFSLRQRKSKAQTNAPTLIRVLPVPDINVISPTPVPSPSSTSSGSEEPESREEVADYGSKRE